MADATQWEDDEEEEEEEHYETGPIHFAASNCNVEALRNELARGVSANRADDFGQTPLHWLNQSSEENCARGGAECLEALRAAGADINATCDAYTPLSEAACRVHPSLQLFLNAGADVNFRNRQLYGSCTALEMVIDTTSLNPWFRDSRRHVYPTLLRAGSELPRAQFMEAMRQRPNFNEPYIENVIAAGSLANYERLHLTKLTSMFQPKFPFLPKEVVQRVVEFWSHAGDY